MTKGKLCGFARAFLVVALCGMATTAGGAPRSGSVAAPPRLPAEQLLLLRESVFNVAVIGTRLWPGWTRVPLTTLVIGEEREFLVNAPEDAELEGEFQPNGQEFDDRAVFSRPRSFDPGLRSTMRISGLPTAVLGAWNWAEETPNEWVLTLAREWFHVLQLYRDQEERAEELGLLLPGEPQSQLRHEFPYDDPDVGNALHLLGQAIHEALSDSRLLPQDEQRAFVAETVLSALQNVRTMVQMKHGEEAYGHFRFAIWRNGVARYTQVQLARRIAEREIAEEFHSRPGFDLLKGSISYSRFWEEEMRARYWMILNSGRLADRNITTLYAIGHGIAELLDTLDGDWRERYFDRGVWLEDLLAEALRKPAADRSPGDPSRKPGGRSATRSPAAAGSSPGIRRPPAGARHVTGAVY